MLSAELVAGFAMGDGSSEPDPRCQLIRSGASVLVRRCPPSGGRQGG
jgi:hypothetical protein